jgi:hypothetical protein
MCARVDEHFDLPRFARKPQNVVVTFSMQTLGKHTADGSCVARILECNVAVCCATNERRELTSIVVVVTAERLQRQTILIANSHKIDSAHRL